MVGSKGHLSKRKPGVIVCHCHPSLNSTMPETIRIDASHVASILLSQFKNQLHDYISLTNKKRKRLELGLKCSGFSCSLAYMRHHVPALPFHKFELDELLKSSGPSTPFNFFKIIASNLLLAYI